MKFQIQTIYCNDDDCPKPFCVEFTVPDEENILVIDVGVKPLQNFLAFQKIVANAFGLWLSPDRERGWGDKVSEGFDNGRRGRTTEPEVQNNPVGEALAAGVVEGDETGSERGLNESCKCCERHDIRADTATDQNTKRFLAFIKNGLAIYETGLLTGDDEFSGNEIDSLAKRVKLIFEAAEEDRFHKSFAEAEHERALEVKNAAKARQLLAEINELPEELSLAIMESLEGKHANTH